MERAGFPVRSFFFFSFTEYVMTHIVDRRAQGGKSQVNRQRLIERYKDQVRDAVEKAVKEGSVTDAHEGGVNVPIRGTNEPTFRNGPGGNRTYILPGNKKGEEGHIRGDKLPRPKGGGGGGGGKASNSGEGEDDFMFHLTADEYWSIIFADLELPNMTKQHFSDDSNIKMRVNAGITTVGPQPRMHLLRSRRQALGRHIAFRRRETKKKLETLEKELRELLLFPEENAVRIAELEEEIANLKKKVKNIPYFDKVDLRFRVDEMKPAPIAKAVMFCLMDVSGSMSQELKELAKRFFLLLYVFLRKNYEKIEVVFIKHTTNASETNEKDFFYGRESGGTLVSTSLVLMKEIIEKRYNPEEWNIYGAQASDGDNWREDDRRCMIAMEEILPLVQHFAYVQVGSQGTRNVDELWATYLKIKENPGWANLFDMKMVCNPTEIFPVFRELFKKRGAA